MLSGRNKKYIRVQQDGMYSYKDNYINKAARSVCGGMIYQVVLYLLL
jgi:hypothetical protein